MHADFEFMATKDGPILVGSSAPRLAELLNQLEGHLVRAGSATHLLNPGLSGQRIRNQLAASGLSAPDELIVWFGWHDGRVLDDPRSFDVIPNFPIASLSEAIERHEEFTSEFPGLDPRDENDWGIPRGWLSLTQTNYGTAVHCLGEPSASPQVRVATPFFYEEDGHRAVSLCTLVAWWIVGLGGGGYVRREPRFEYDGWWDVDRARLHPLQVESLFA
ncbi:MAG: hypothetical protein LCH43_14610 [Actinobacteria bacterium]|nr:hypothetical protein [Actinomycetota bacterium]